MQSNDVKPGVRMPIEVHMEEMSFPNFLRVKEWKDSTYPVALLTDEQAAAFWDEQKPKWLEHVAKRRAADKRSGST